MRLSADEWAMLIDVGKGISSAESFMGELTDYHGDAVKTEYLLSVGIARALLGSSHRRVELEYLANKVSRSIFAQAGVVWSLGSNRFDVAVLGAGPMPEFLAEAKIRVQTLFGLVAADITKMATFMAFFQSTVGTKLLGASVFQVHVAVPMDRGDLVDRPGRRRRVRQKLPRRQCLAETMQRAHDLEARLKAELVALAAARPGFEFCWVEFQGPDDRIHDDEIDWEGDGEDAVPVLGRPGYACRYHGVLVRRLDDPAAPGRAVGPLFVHPAAPQRLDVDKALVP